MILPEELENEVDQEEKLKDVGHQEPCWMIIISESVACKVGVHEVANKNHTAFHNHETPVPNPVRIEREMILFHVV